MKAKAEEWRSIPGLPGYEASSEGRIRSHSGVNGAARILKPHIDRKNGCITNNRITLPEGGSRKTFQVARPVYTAWFGNIPDGQVVCCRNGNMTDAKPSNLFLSDRSKRFSERARKVGGSNRRPVVKIDRTLAVIEVYQSARQAARKNGFRCKYYITSVCNFQFKSSVFAADGFLYAWDDTRSIWTALKKAMRELDALGQPYNNPFTGRYFDLPFHEDDEIDLGGLQFAEASPLEPGGVMTVGA